MKNTPKRTPLLLLALILVALVSLASCASTVQVKGLVPAEIDLGKYRNLAVASTKSFSFNSYSRPSAWVRSMGAGNISVASGIPRNLEAQVASYATDRLVNTLQQTGFFRLIQPEVTDAYIAGASVGLDSFSLLRQSGATALLNSSINYMDCDEYVYSKLRTKWVTVDESGNTVPGHEVVVGTDYYLVQTATVTFSYSIIDLSTGSILAARSFSDKVNREVELGRYDSFAPSVVPLYTKMIDAFQGGLRKQLAPSWVTKTIYLMDNKPKNEAAKAAYKQVDKGNIQIAYALFLDQWTEARHVPSGYNAALMLEAVGDLNGAIGLLQQVYDYSHNVQCYESLLRMQQALVEQTKAEEQLTGGTSSGDGEVSVTQVVTGN